MLCIESAIWGGAENIPPGVLTPRDQEKRLEVLSQKLMDKVRCNYCKQKVEDNLTRNLEDGSVVCNDCSEKGN